MDGHGVGDSEHAHERADGSQLNGDKHASIAISELHDVISRLPVGITIQDHQGQLPVRQRGRRHALQSCGVLGRIVASLSVLPAETPAGALHRGAAHRRGRAQRRARQRCVGRSRIPVLALADHACGSVAAADQHHRRHDAESARARALPSRLLRRVDGSGDPTAGREARRTSCSPANARRISRSSLWTSTTSRTSTTITVIRSAMRS